MVSLYVILITQLEALFERKMPPLPLFFSFSLMNCSFFLKKKKTTQLAAPQGVIFSTSEIRAIGVMNWRWWGVHGPPSPPNGTDQCLNGSYK